MGIWNRLNAAHERAMNRLWPGYQPQKVVEVDVDRDEYAGLHPDIRPVDHSSVEMYDEDRTLEEVARHSPDELSYVEWTALAEERGVDLDQVAEYTALPAEERPLSIEGENERAARHDAFIEASYDNELSLTDEATVMPGNLSYENWLDLAAARGVELDQLPEWVALDPVQRPLSPEAEAARDAREEAYVERQLAEAYEADAKPDPEAQAGFEALENHPRREYGNRLAGFMHEGQQLYALRDRGGDGVQILTPEEAEAELGDQREHDISHAVPQAIHEDASYEADQAMPDADGWMSLGGNYESAWEAAEQISGARYRERVAELTQQQGIAYDEIGAEQDRLLQLAERDFERKREEGLEICPF